MHYGTGAYGGLRGTIKNGQIILFRLDLHCQRLSRSAKLLSIDISPDFIRSKIIEFVQRNQPTQDFYIRPLVYVSDLGIAPRLYDVKTDFLIYGLPLGDYLNPKGVSCRFSSWIRQEDRSVPLRGKITGSYTMAAMAKTEAHESGFDESLVFNSQGKVCEASAMNLFLVRDGKPITPGVDQDILEGITRRSVLRIAQDMGIATIERSVDKSELLIANEVFLTGTAGKVTPVYKIENYNLAPTHPITDSIRQQFEQILDSKLADYQDWITKVDLKN